MAKIGVLIETKDGEVKKTTLGVLTLARQDPAGEVYALVLGPNVEACRESLKQYGADRIVAIQTPEAEIAWNFEKFLVSRDGYVVRRFSPRTEPNDPELIATLEAMLSGSAAAG